MIRYQTSSRWAFQIPGARDLEGWSSGIQVHELAASGAEITPQRTVDLLTGAPASGPAPTEAGEVRREHVWCFQVREVLYPNASCDYEFLLPISARQS